MNNIQLYALVTVAMVGGGYIAEKFADKTIQLFNINPYVKINKTAGLVLRGIAMLTGAAFALVAVGQHHKNALFDKKMINHLFSEIKKLRIQLNELQTPPGCMPIPLRPFVIKLPD